MGEIRVIPIPGMPEVLPGDDLVAFLLRALRELGVGLLDDDVLAVTQKVVSKAEGRVVAEGPDGKAGWVAREGRRIVAQRDEVVIAETRHGFVCANAGVDASNVGEGFLTLLPEDPDGSAESIRAAVSAATGARIGVVITDTFGRAWRRGVVNVAIGCAGLPALVDLRGTKDATGRILEATIVALSDEIAAASGLVMGKADGIPAAIVRGVRSEAPLMPASGLLRPPEEDLFRESPLQALMTTRPVVRFEEGTVSRQAVEEAVRAACVAMASTGRGRMLVVAAQRGPLRRRIIAALEAEDLPTAPLLLVPFVRSVASHDPARADESNAMVDALRLMGGAAVQNLMLALHAQGIASNWSSDAATHAGVAGEVIGVSSEWIALGVVAAGPEVSGPGPEPLEIDVASVLRELP